MEKIFTNSLQMNMTALIFVSMCFVFSACSASDESLSSSTEDNVEKITIQNDEGETVIKMQGDKVLSVKKNGKELSEDEKNIYLQELQSKPGFFTWYDVHPKFDFDKFKINMKHFSDDSLAKNFHFNFNNKEFQAGMEKLKEKIKDMNFPDFKFNFNDEEFQIQMEELDSNLQNIKIEIPEINIDFDEDNLETLMSELAENLDDEMDKLDFDMKELNLELKKLNDFIGEVKSEMIKDGILKNADEEITIDFDSNELKLNGKVIPDNLKEKYKAMFEKHFGKELNGDCNFYFTE
ncbi:MAG: hypothetical protein IPH11_13440 [Ignavibacteriales bacterium]|nr:hypothetical protein [Ignavibacteriales bacterium]